MKNITTILLADDDEDDRVIFCEVIADLDASINCITVNHGLEAMAWLLDHSTNPPDYIFLDLNMPRLNGKQCLSLIKNNPLLRNIPVVIYSTTSRDKDKDEIYQAGAGYFITKPNNLAALRSEIAAAIQLKEPVYRQ